MANGTEIKESKKVKSGKKAFYKRWWFKAFVIIVVLSALTGNSESKPEEIQETAPTTVVAEATEVTQVEEHEVRVACKMLMNRFVEDILVEDFHMFDAFEADVTGLNDKGNGTIEVLYLPNKAGNGETKVNMTVEKSGDKYTITYILLEGLYEVDMHTVPNEYLSIVY